MGHIVRIPVPEGNRYYRNQHAPPEHRFELCRAFLRHENRKEQVRSRQCIRGERIQFLLGVARNAFRVDARVLARLVFLLVGVILTIGGLARYK